MLGGREREVRHIVALLDEPPLTSGQVRIIQIEGAIGVGKSALVTHVLLQIQTDPDAPPRRVFHAHGDRLHADAPLTPLRPMIEDLLGAPLEQLLDSTTPSALARRCAETLGQTAGQLIVTVDDAQWLDPASEQFLISLIHTPTTEELTVLLVHRLGQEPTGLLVAARQRGAVHDHLFVEPLPDAVVEQIAGSLRPEQRQIVVQTADGNPLFARTIAAAFRRHPEAMQVAEVLHLARGSQTEVLGAAVADDLNSLDNPARRVLEALAVMGRPVEPAILAAIADLSPPAVEKGLQDLRERGLLAQNLGESLHPVVRFSVYENTAVERLSAMHRRAAHRPGVELFERADHVAQVARELSLDEVDVLVRAARVAIGSDPRTVVGWLSRFSQRHHTVDSSILLARAMILTGDITEAIESLRSVVAASPEATEARVLLAHALRMTGQTAEARAVLAVAADTVDAEILREYIDIVALVEGSVPAPLLVRLRAVPGEINRVVASIYRTMDLLSEGDVKQARVAFTPVPGWFSRAESREVATVLHALACAVWAAYILDQFETASRMAERGLQLAHRYGQADVWANLGAGRCYSQAALGLLDEAEESAHQAIADAERYGTPDIIAMAKAGLMITAQGRADPTLLKQRFNDLAEVPLPEFGWWRRAVLTTRTRVSAVLGQPVASPELWGEPIDAMAAIRHADAALTAAALGDPDTAWLLSERGIKIAEEQDSPGQKAMVQVTQAEMLLGGTDESDRETVLRSANLFRASADAFQRLGMRLQLGRALHGLGRTEAILAQRSELLAELTAREREVIVLVAQGLKNREIAARLVLSPRTPEYHVRNVLKKWGLGSRSDIIRVVKGGEIS